MELFYFRSETHQCLITAACWKSAVENFSSAIKDIYGSTLKGIELNSECAVTVHWREEDTLTINKDLFEVQTLPENSLFWFSDTQQEPPLLMLPQPTTPVIEAKAKISLIGKQIIAGASRKI